jgi:hypothetical protein
MNEPRRLDLSGVYQRIADGLVRARADAIAIHGTGDIRAAGNQVEMGVRNTIGERLPKRVRTTHGHILDYNGRVSPQLDLIVAEALSSKSLFEADDGTEYVPYESVYAIGGIRSTYYKSSQPVPEFSRVLAGLQQLDRQTHIKNPLLSFMFFVAANDFAVEDIEDHYRSTPREELPTFVCLLDRGVVIFSRVLRNGYGQPIPTQYYLADTVSAAASEHDKWALLEWGDESERCGANLMFVHLALIQHLDSCQVAMPNLSPYFILSLKPNGGVLFE